MFVHEDFIQLYEQVKTSKDVTVYAAFRAPSPLQKLQQFVKVNKDDWLAAFTDYDENCICRVRPEEFILGLQVLITIDTLI